MKYNGAGYLPCNGYVPCQVIMVIKMNIQLFISLNKLLPLEMERCSQNQTNQMFGSGNFFLKRIFSLLLLYLTYVKEAQRKSLKIQNSTNCFGGGSMKQMEGLCNFFLFLSKTPNLSKPTNDSSTHVKQIYLAFWQAA